MQHSLLLDSSAEEGTRISISVEVTGAVPSRDKEADMRVLEKIVQTWSDNLSRECDRVAEDVDGTQLP